jgi:ketosteroid isomerase-like protein
MSTEDEVRKASERFYAAINQMLNGDASEMASVWSHGTSVTTMHPVGGCEVGWEKVQGPWRELARLTSEGKAILVDQVIQVAGDMGYEVGIEKGQVTLAGQKVPIEHRVTNVYRREAGGWKIVHHHADLSPAMLDVLARLQGRKQSAAG